MLIGNKKHLKEFKSIIIDGLSDIVQSSIEVACISSP